MLKLDKGAILIDIETTGKHGMKYSICELAAVKINKDLEIVEQFNTDNYIKPLEEKYLKEAMSVHKIPKRKLKNAPSFPDVIKEFEEWCGNAEEFDMMAWGICFDITFMQCQYYKIGRKWPFNYKYWDLRSVARLVKLLKYVHEDYSLMDYVNMLDVKKNGETLHSAMGDVQLEYKLLKKIIEGFEADFMNYIHAKKRLNDCTCFMRGGKI